MQVTCWGVSASTWGVPYRRAGNSKGERQEREERHEWEEMDRDTGAFQRGYRCLGTNGSARGSVRRER